MVHLIFAGLFMLGGLAATGYAERSAARTPAAQSTPAAAGPWPAVALLCAAAVALMAREPPGFMFKGAVALALLIAFVTALLQMIPGTPPVVRAGGNTVAYFVLWLGFAVSAGRAFWSLPGLLAFVGGVVLVGALYFLFHARLRWLSLSVMLYTANLALVVGSAAALCAVHPALWSVLALAGALLYTGSDLLAAWHAWRKPVPRCVLYDTLLIAGGALLLAVATWGDALSHLWPQG